MRILIWLSKSASFSLFDDRVIYWYFLDNISIVVRASADDICRYLAATISWTVDAYLFIYMISNSNMVPYSRIYVYANVQAYKPFISAYMEKKPKRCWMKSTISTRYDMCRLSSVVLLITGIFRLLKAIYSSLTDYIHLLVIFDGIDQFELRVQESFLSLNGFLWITTVLIDL